MVVQNAKAIFLGLTEREASGEKKAWTALDYVVVGENASRRTFIDRTDPKLLAAARQIAVRNWGDAFLFDGNIDSRGGISFTSLYEETDVFGDEGVR